MEGLFNFASDRGGVVYAYDMNDGMRTIVEYYDDTIDRAELRPIANSFVEFVKYAYDYEYSEE
mgnify:CR=1 FL=1